MSEIKFKVGDRVYFPVHSTEIFTVRKSALADDGYPIAIKFKNKDTPIVFFIDGRWSASQAASSLIKATQENYELLSKLHPSVEFEKPPVRRASREVIQAMLDDGWGRVPVYYYEGKEECCGYATKTYATMTAEPFDPKTGKVIVDYVNGEIVTE